MTEPAAPPPPEPSNPPTFRRRSAARAERIRLEREALMARLPPDVRAALGRPPRVTQALVVSLLLVFGFQVWVDMLASPILMMRFGANVPGLVFAGEWWRLVSGNFLHGSALHLAFNGWALFVLGGVLERVLDGRRLLLVYLASALAGAATSAAFSGALLAVGASTAVFGLLGGLAAVQWRAGPRLHGVFRQSRRWWIIILVINGGLSFLVPRVDGAAHVGGFVAGGLLGLWLGGPKQPLLAASKSPLVVLVSSILSGIFVAGLGLTVWHAERFDDRSTARAVAAVTAHAGSEGDVLNFFAWEVAVDPHAGVAGLESAVAAAAEAAQRAPDQAEILDTQAQALHRLGRQTEALWLELTALARLPEAFYATQVGRFAQALAGAQRAAKAQPEPAAGLRLSVRPGGQRLALDWPAGSPRTEDWLMVAQAIETDSAVGTLVIRVASRGGEVLDGDLVLNRDGVVGTALPESARLDVLWAAPLPADSRTFKAPVAAPGWRYWPRDAKALELDAAKAVAPPRF